MTANFLEKLFIGVGVVMAVIAVGFGSSTTNYQGDPTYSQAGAACGFAIASGLCFLAVAIVHRDKLSPQANESIDQLSKPQKPIV